MPCSRKETLARLFTNVTSTLKFFFLLFYLLSLFVAKLFTYFFRSEDEYDEGLLYEEEEGEEDETIEMEEEEDEEQDNRYSDVEGDHLVADVVNGGEGLVFVADDFHQNEYNHTHVHTNSYESVFNDPAEAFDDETVLVESCPSSDLEHDHNDDDADYELVKGEYTSIPESKTTDERINVSTDVENNNDNDHHERCLYQSWQDQSPYRDVSPKSPINIKSTRSGSDTNAESIPGESHGSNTKIEVQEPNFTKEEKYLSFEPTKWEAQKLEELNKHKDEMFEDSYTVGSTSKSSSEWRSSIRDSGTDDPFSSSSRRSCPKWESYTVYQKYDEEMMFLHRISVQKLHETESLRAIQVEPRSISQRIVHKLAANNNEQRSSEHVYKNSYYELEAAYVAQICLSWEALNWNYASFQRRLVSRIEHDPGCPAYIAQQFQQFQVHLQRYIENEPYERGRRPEVYARKRSVAPKLLQVPEYHDYEAEEKDEILSARITSASFFLILEDAIRTFMNFLKADRESHCQVLSALFKGRRRGSIDPSVLRVVKIHNKKKKTKLKDLQRTRICLRKRKMTREEEMVILMALIDLKVVSRVLRMVDITQDQLHWCEEKMGKLRLLEGRLLRDSSPLFFPAH